MLITLILAAGLARFVGPERQVNATAEASEHFKAGMVALSSERYEKAEAEFKRATVLDPLYDAAFYGLGQVYMATRRYEQALRAYLDSRKAFDAAIAADQADGVAADRRLRDQLQASRDFGRTLQRMSPTQSPGLAAAIERNREEQRQLEARLNRSKGGPAPPVPAGLLMALGSAYFRTGKLEEAERAYQEAIKADPAFGEAHSNLAVVYLQTNRVEQAAQELTLAERAGFRVNPNLKADVQSRLGKP